MATNYILKENLTGLCPPEVTTEIVGNTVQKSAVMNMAKAVEMKKAEKVFPVFLSKPGAYFIGEGERISVKSATFANVKLVAKKLGIIVPMSKEALNDSVIDVMNEVKGAIAEAFAVRFDNEVLFGSAGVYTNSVYSAAVEAGNLFTRGSVEGQDLADDISDTMALIEDAGYDVNGFIAKRNIKNALRKLKDKDGNRLYVENLKTDGAVNELYNLPIEFAGNDVFDNLQAEIFTGNWDYAYYGILNDIAYEVLKEATLQGVTGVDGQPLSLAEQDMIAIKATMRVGFLVVKDSAFAVLKPKVQG
jgi:HK97 family phage major capsid protein